jgi:serine-type D-Ala-D-Ala carboxypeptidase (penicillin-binding protein 5/6)
VTRFFKLLLGCLAVALVQGGLALAQQVTAFEPKAPQIYLVEASTNTVLYARGEDELIPPASLVKLMTAEYVLHEIKTGKISDNTEYKVSEYAWRTGGALSRTSTMFAALNSDIRVIDLLQGVIVQLANDACIILAEGLAGSEAKFAELLTKRAREIGLEKSVFANSNGLPDPGNLSTMRELVELSRQIKAEYPNYFKFYAQEAFEWNKIFQRNKNALVAQNIGVDGMAMGFAEGYGYSVVATVERNGVRLFLAMGGLKTDKERAEEARRVLDWGLTNFHRQVVFRKGELIADAPVFGGDTSHVPLVADEDIDIYVPNDNPDRIRARIAYRWPLKAPVTKAQKIGTLQILLGEKAVRSVPVHASAAVGTGTLTSKAYDGLKELLFFWL